MPRRKLSPEAHARMLAAFRKTQAYFDSPGQESPMSQDQLKAEAIRQLKLFIGTDATGHACRAYQCLVAMELNLCFLKPVAQWVPAYAAGILDALESMA